MKRFVWSGVILLIACSSVLAQHLDTAWVYRYNGAANGDDRMAGFCVDMVGRSVLVGTSFNGATTDMLTIFHQVYNDTVWTRRFTRSGAVPTAVDVQKGYGVYNPFIYVAGCVDSDLLVVKYNFNTGDTIWTRTYDGPAHGIDSALGIAVDDFGNAYVTGTSKGLDKNAFDAVTIKYLPNGDTAWVRRWNNVCNAYFCSDDRTRIVKVDNSGNVYVAGMTGWTTMFDMLTIKYYPNGDTVWVRTYNPDPGPEFGDDNATGLVVDQAGNVYVTGSAGSPPWGRYATIKYDPSGKVLWSTKYIGPDDYDNRVKAITYDERGYLYVTGESMRRDNYTTDYLTIKYTTNGDTVWTRRYNGPANLDDKAAAIGLDTAGSVCVSGTSVGIGSGTDFATIKYFPNGDVAWTARYNGSGSGDDNLVSTVVDRNTDVFVSGTSTGAGTGSDMVTVKYRQSCCLGYLGNVDGSMDRVVDIGDLFLLIDYITAPIELGPTICQAAANVDGMGGIDISDVMALIDFLSAGLPLTPCP